jgi:hypothetical protein
MTHVENSEIGFMIICAIAVLGMTAFYFDFVHPRTRRPRHSREEHDK